MFWGLKMEFGTTSLCIKQYWPTSMLFAGLLILAYLWSSNFDLISKYEAEHLPKSSNCYVFGLEYTSVEMMTFFNETCDVYIDPKK